MDGKAKGGQQLEGLLAQALGSALGQGAEAETAFAKALLASFSMIVVSEIGDKTFLIAAIMAMAGHRCQVLAGGILALALMTALSTGFGLVLPRLLPRAVTAHVSAGLFAAFGFKMVREGWRMGADRLQQEYAEVQHELDSDLSVPSSPGAKVDRMERGQTAGSGPGSMEWLKSSILVRVFTLTFLAEWGDRSQIATIALAAAQDPLGVTVGATIGHALCTLLAVLCGSVMARVVSIRTGTFRASHVDS